MKSYSQAAQDLFVCSVLKNKYNGTFLEIGSNHPITHNNTYSNNKMVKSALILKNESVNTFLNYKYIK